MSEDGLHRLPPFNPMRTAPREGEKILAMLKFGEIRPFSWAVSPWDGRPKWRDLTGAETYGLDDDDLLGWWPLPDVSP